MSMRWNSLGVNVKSENWLCWCGLLDHFIFFKQRRDTFPHQLMKGCPGGFETNRVLSMISWYWRLNNLDNSRLKATVRQLKWDVVCWLEIQQKTLQIFCVNCWVVWHKEQSDVGFRPNFRKAGHCLGLNFWTNYVSLDLTDNTVRPTHKKLETGFQVVICTLFFVSSAFSLQLAQGCDCFICNSNGTSRVVLPESLEELDSAP